ncbi:MAG: hypothetical protein ACYSWZ_27240 [Planctomycetota bacterium]
MTTPSADGTFPDDSAFGGVGAASKICGGCVPAPEPMAASLT